MGSLSVSIPDELRDRMEQIDEINWSAVARKAFEEKIGQVEFLKTISAKSKLTEKDAEELSRKINKSMAEKFKAR